MVGGCNFKHKEKKKNIAYSNYIFKVTKVLLQKKKDLLSKIEEKKTKKHS